MDPMQALAQLNQLQQMFGGAGGAGGGAAAAQQEPPEVRFAVRVFLSSFTLFLCGLKLSTLSHRPSSIFLFPLLSLRASSY
jgi:hypothetical protein